MHIHIVYIYTWIDTDISHWFHFSGRTLTDTDPGTMKWGTAIIHKNVEEALELGNGRSQRSSEA